MSQYVSRVGAVSLTAATLTTLVQVVPGTRALTLVEWGISFNGATSTNVPVTVELVTQSTAGTSSALTPVKWDERAEAVVHTARLTFTVEPTLVATLATYYLTPAGGLFVMQYPLGREIVASTNRLGLRVNAPNTVSASAYLVVSE